MAMCTARTDTITIKTPTQAAQAAFFAMNAYTDDTLYEYSDLHGLERWLHRLIRAYQYGHLR